MKSRLKTAVRSALPFIILSILGFFFRMGFATVSEPGLIWDMNVFHKMALDMLPGRLVANCCFKTVGYSAFLSVIYGIFGPDNLTAVRVIQAATDTLTAGLVYIASHRLFGRNAGLLSFLLYLTNPITASYVGLRLSETLTLFVITAIAVILTVADYRKKPFFWLSTGALLGLLVFVRVQFSLISIVTLFLMALFAMPRRKALLYLTISLTGYLIGSSYTLAANFKEYGLVSLKPPYQPVYSALYANFFNDRRYPELDTDPAKLHPDYQRINVEVFQISLDNRPLYESITRKLFFDKLRLDWPVFVRHTLQNSVYIWDKKHLSAYTDIFYPADSTIIRLYNIALIVLFFLGFGGHIRKSGLKALRSPFVITVTAFLAISTAMFSLVSNETRHTVAFYSLIIIFAGAGLDRLIGYFKPSETAGITA